MISPSSRTTGKTPISRTGKMCSRGVIGLVIGNDSAACEADERSRSAVSAPHPGPRQLYHISLRLGARLVFRHQPAQLALQRRQVAAGADRRQLVDRRAEGGGVAG